MCLYNQLVKNPKFKKNAKNGGNIPPVRDLRTLYVPIGCGKCMECKKQKAREWQVRLMEDIKYNKGQFITLTFSTESLNKLSIGIDATGYALDNAICTKAVHLFRERWRKRTGKSIRHWLITELGHNGTEHVHIHGILFTTEHIDIIKKTWEYGFIWPRERQEQLTTWINDQTVNYMIKYILKRDLKHKHYNSKILSSPGIGSGYITNGDAQRNKFNGENTIETYKTKSGHEIALPIYYRNKIYTDREREQLWIYKLNKEERFVNKVNIDISKGQEGYAKAVLNARKLNNELGYGSIKVNEQEKEYEEAKRIIMQETRIKKKTANKEIMKINKQMNLNQTAINTIRTQND